MPKKITAQMILNWHGDGDIHSLADYLAAILNEEFSVEDAKKEISDYNYEE